MLDSQWVAQQIGHPVIKAFNNIFPKAFSKRALPKGTKGRIALSVAGDSLDAKAAVLRLVDDLGFDPVDGGDLDNSWRQQPGTPAYCQDLEATALRRALAKLIEAGSRNTARTGGSYQEVYRSADSKTIRGKRKERRRGGQNTNGVKSCFLYHFVKSASYLLQE